MADEKVKVKIKPLHGIGGVGEAGDVVMMSREDAEMYVRDGYVELLAVSGEQLAESGASSAPVGLDTPMSAKSASAIRPAEDHEIMKPEVKRAKKVVRKK